MKLQLFLDDEGRIRGYQTFPIDEKEPIYEIDIIPEDLCSGEYGVKNSKIVKLGLTEHQTMLNKENQKNVLRVKRIPLLEAFDKWEKAVLRKRELDDTQIMQWYYRILDLDEYSINNVPQRIKYYLQ